MTLNFDELKQRLRESVDRLGTHGDAAQVEWVLRQRTRQLASHGSNVTIRRQVGEVVVVRRAQSQFGFPIQDVDEVREVVVGRLPHRSPHICGLFQLRGQVSCLVDLQPFVGATTELDHHERTLAIVVRAPGGNLGVRIDEVLGPRVLHADEMDPGHRDGRLEFVSAVTRDCVEVVDVATLLASPALKMTGGR
jgi:chemotaxis signal transduction protein